MKEAYYFSHDSNARQDEKILMLRAEHGWEGYGIYWALIEMMFESTESALHHSKVKGIAVSYNIDMTLLKQIINTCIEENLFQTKDDLFWSDSLIRRKEKFRDIKNKRSEAGKKGAAKRWGDNEEDGNAMAKPSQNHSDDIAKNSKGKERKENKSKGNESKGQESKVENATSYLSENFFNASLKEKESLFSFIDDLGDELCIEAMTRTRIAEKKLSYALGILRQWYAKGIRNMKDVECDDDLHNKNSNIRQFKPRRQQHEYDPASDAF